jgi:hypothetical protein
MVHMTNIIVVVLSELPLVFHIEFMLHSLYSFFAHNLKKFLKFTKLAKKLETKRLYLLRNVKTYWISMLGPLKCVLAQYKSLVVKMHSNYEKSKSAHDNFELLCELDLIMSMPCVMPILEVVHSLIKYAQHRDVFIMDFLDVINLVKTKLFHFYIDPFSHFDDFTKLL